jgi:hypothetical protein
VLSVTDSFIPAGWQRDRMSADGEIWSVSSSRWNDAIVVRYEQDRDHLAGRHVPLVPIKLLQHSNRHSNSPVSHEYQLPSVSIATEEDNFMKTRIATLLTLVLLTNFFPTVSAKPKGDWNAVKALANTSIAVRTTNGETHFGLLQSADDNAITVQIAGKDDFTSQEIVFRRDEIEKVWRAKLRFGEKNIAKGALIGAGAGLGAALITASVLAKRNSDDPPVGLGAFPLYGAGSGTIVGVFWRKKHKKQELVYSR